MIHPNFELKHINSTIGFGLISKCFLPIGTIIYAHDKLDICLKNNSPIINDPLYKKVFEEYSFTIGQNVIIPWDNGKFINHSCENFNALAITNCSCACSIVVKDFHEKDEWLEDYTMYFELGFKMQCFCQSPNCTKLIFNQTANEEKNKIWSDYLNKAFSCITDVKQPLVDIIKYHKHSNPNCPIKIALGLKNLNFSKD